MHWYGGSIAEAVTLSKQKNAIFVVFVEGDNDLSAEMAATIDDTAVLSRLSDQGNFLAVKLKSGSTNYTHFAQIYQFVPVPSLFFIGRNGTPLEVVCAGVLPSNLAVRIDRILEEHFKDKQPLAPGMHASTSSPNIREQTVSFVQTEAAAMSQQVAPEDKAKVEPESGPKLPLPKNMCEQKVNFVQKEIAANSQPADPEEKVKLGPISGSKLPIPKNMCEQTVNCVQTETTAKSQQAATEDKVKVGLRSGSKLPIPKNLCEQTVNFGQTNTTVKSPQVATEEKVKVGPKSGSKLPLPKNMCEQTASFVQTETTSKSPPATTEVKVKVEPVTGSKLPISKNMCEQTVNFVQKETIAMTQPAAPKEKDNVEPVPGSPRAKIPKTDTPAAEKDPESEFVCDGDVCVRRPRVKPDEPGPSQAPTPSLPDTPAVDAQESLLPTTESIGSMEEKMERAKELIEARRREKADKEKELEKEKEIERREAGKGVAELKRWQADQELKQIQEERRREKMENNLARQRILEQIAQDRLERRARDQPQSTQPQHSVQPPATSGDGGGRARIQFKLPDGTSHTAHFDADGSLADVQRYVADNLQLSTSSFSLWTAFPRRELTEADASLRGLQLAPSAALLVLSRRTAPATVARPSAISSIIAFFTQLFTTILLEPSQQVFVWLRTRLFPPPASTPRVSPQPPAGPAPPVPTPPSPTAGARRRGNIHRLPSDRAPDDDNNTWNGNSTQQM